MSSSICRRRRVGALDRTGHAVVIEQAAPAPKHGQVLVRVKASLISAGTELAGARAARAAGRTDPGRPQPFGYQNAGQVVAVGRGVKRFSPGDRVACMGGGFALHTDLAAVPQNLCARMPDGLDDEQAVYVHLAATSLHAVRRAQIQLGEYVLVMGLGVVGQLAGQFAALDGAYVMGSDPLDWRCRVAVRCGFAATAVTGEHDLECAARTFTDGHGFDHAVLAFSGEGTDTFELVKQLMKRSPDGHEMGNVVLVGGLTTQCLWGAAMGNLNLLGAARTGPGYHDRRWEHGQRPYPCTLTRWTTRSNMVLVLRLMAEGRIKTGPLTSHRLPLTRIDEAVSLHLDAPHKTLGTVLLMDEP